MILWSSEEAIEDLQSYVIGAKLNMDEEIFKEINDRGAEVHRAMLGALICGPASSSQELVRMHKVNSAKYINLSVSFFGNTIVPHYRLVHDAVPTSRIIVWGSLMHGGAPH